MKHLIIGGGVSGYGAAKLLRKQGRKVTLSESKHLEEHQRKRFLDLGVEIFDSGHDDSHLEGVEKIILSPGIPQNLSILNLAREKNIPIISEVDLALENYSGQLIAVTGTNGKSTTCAMIAHIFERAGVKSSLGGNFGIPPSELLADGNLENILIAELSSYQLEISTKIKPAVSIFTSFSHDHLARHGTLENYLKAKWKVFDLLKEDGLAVIPDYILKLADSNHLSLRGTKKIIDLENLQKVVNVSSANQKERHNQLNAVFATLAAGFVLRKSPEELAPLLSDYHGLPHRCEVVGTIKGCDIINDSKSTNVESTLAALSSQEKPVILLMGGKGKNEPYQPVTKFKDKISRLYTFGASGKLIHEELKAKLSICENYPTLESALSAVVQKVSRYPSPILFSPGCASFDEFQNYEARGRFFVEKMRKVFD